MKAELILWVFSLNLVTVASGVSLHRDSAENIKIHIELQDFPLLQNCSVSLVGVNKSLEVNCQGAGFYRLPELPLETVYLRFAYNGLSQFDGFKNIYKNLILIDFSFNPITKIETFAFFSTPNLQSLSLADNHLDLFKMNSSILTPLANIHYLNVGNILYFTAEQQCAHQQPYDILSCIEAIIGVIYDYPNQFLAGARQLKELTTDATLLPVGGFLHNVNVSALEMLRITGYPLFLKNNSLIHLRESRITHLSFKSCIILGIEQNAFSHLRYLTILDLSEIFVFDMMSLAPGWIGLQHTNIKEIDLSSTNNILYLYEKNTNNLTSQDILKHQVPHVLANHDNRCPVVLNDEFFVGLENTNVKKLTLNDNRIEKISTILSSKLPHLEHLSLVQNNIGFIDRQIILSSVREMHNLMYLDMSHQTVQNDDVLLIAGQVYFVILIPPSLEILNITGIHSKHKNGITQKPHTKSTIHIVDAKNLRILNNSDVIVPIFRIRINFVCQSNSGIELYLDRKMTNVFDFKRVFENETSSLYVKGLSLSGNRLNTYLNTVDKNGLKYVSNITFLDLSGNELNDLPGTFLSSAKFLKRIHLAKNMLKELPRDIPEMAHLVYLDISYNLLTDINMKTIKTLETHRWQNNVNAKLTLDLIGNPLICSCDTLEFLSWANSKRDKPSGIVLKDINKYICSWKNGQTLWNKSNLTDIISELSIQCQSKIIIIILGSLLAFIASLTAVSVLVYRHRWDIKFWIVNNTLARKTNRGIEYERHITNDAFLAYHEDDLSWIREHLLPASEENENNFTFILHHRDFIPGTVIEENIIKSIQESRKTILIISSNFLSSQWCQFEVQMARTESFDVGRDIVVPVLLEPISLLHQSPHMTRTLRNILRKRTYLEWPTVEEYREQMLKRLLATIKQPSSEQDLCECGRQRVVTDHSTNRDSSDELQRLI